MTRQLMRTGTPSFEWAVSGRRCVVGQRPRSNAALAADPLPPLRDRPGPQVCARRRLRRVASGGAPPPRAGGGDVEASSIERAPSRA